MVKQQFNTRLDESDVELVEKLRRRFEMSQADVISWALRRLARAEGFLEGPPPPEDYSDSAAYFLNRAGEAFGELSDLAERAQGFVESALDRMDPIPNEDEGSRHP